MSSLVEDVEDVAKFRKEQRERHFADSKYSLNTDVFREGVRAKRVYLLNVRTDRVLSPGAQAFNDYVKPTSGNDEQCTIARNMPTIVQMFWKCTETMIRDLNKARCKAPASERGGGGAASAEDGAVLNNGANNGIITILEAVLGHPIRVVERKVRCATERKLSKWARKGYDPQEPRRRAKLERLRMTVQRDTTAALINEDAYVNYRFWVIVSDECKDDIDMNAVLQRIIDTNTSERVKIEEKRRRRKQSGPAITESMGLDSMPEASKLYMEIDNPEQWARAIGVYMAHMGCTPEQATARELRNSDNPAAAEWAFSYTLGFIHGPSNVDDAVADQMVRSNYITPIENEARWPVLVRMPRPEMCIRISPEQVNTSIVNKFLPTSSTVRNLHPLLARNDQDVEMLRDFIDMVKVTQPDVVVPEAMSAEIEERERVELSRRQQEAMHLERRELEVAEQMQRSLGADMRKVDLPPNVGNIEQMARRMVHSGYDASDLSSFRSDLLGDDEIMKRIYGDEDTELDRLASENKHVLKVVQSSYRRDFDAALSDGINQLRADKKRAQLALMMLEFIDTGPVDINSNECSIFDRARADFYGDDESLERPVVAEQDMLARAQRSVTAKGTTQDPLPSLLPLETEALIVALQDYRGVQLRLEDSMFAQWYDDGDFECDVRDKLNRHIDEKTDEIDAAFGEIENVRRLTRARMLLHKRHMASRLRRHRNEHGDIGSVPRLVHKFRREQRLYRTVKLRNEMFDERYPAFARFIMREVHAASRIVDLSDGSYRAWLIMVHAHLDTSRYVRDMHMHIFEAGAAGASKSYKTDWLKEIRIPLTMETLTRSTRLAKSVKGERDGMLYHQDEADMSQLRDDDKTGEGKESMFKQELTNGEYITQLYTEHPLTGQRTNVTIRYRCISSYIMSSNSDVSLMSDAMRTRFHIMYVGRQVPGAGKGINDRVFAKGMSIGGNSLDELALKNKFLRDRQLLQALFNDVDHLIAIGALNEVSFQTASAFMSVVFEELKKRNCPEPRIRWIKRVRIMTRIMCIIDALQSLFFVPSAKYFGRRIKFYHLLELDRRLVATVQHAAYAMTLLSDEVMLRDEEPVKAALQHWFDEQSRRGDAEWLQTMSISDEPAIAENDRVNAQPGDVARAFATTLQASVDGDGIGKIIKRYGGKDMDVVGGMRRTNKVSDYRYVVFDMGTGRENFSNFARTLCSRIESLDTFQSVPTDNVIRDVLRALSHTNVTTRRYRQLTRLQYNELHEKDPENFPAEYCDYNGPIIEDGRETTTHQAVMFKGTRIMVSVGYLMNAGSMGNVIEDSIRAVLNKRHQITQRIVVGSMERVAPDVVRTIHVGPYWRLRDGVEKDDAKRGRELRDGDYVLVTDALERARIDAKLPKLVVPRLDSVSKTSEIMTHGAPISANGGNISGVTSVGSMTVFDVDLDTFGHMARNEELHVTGKPVTRGHLVRAQQTPVAGARNNVNNDALGESRDVSVLHMPPQSIVRPRIHPDRQYYLGKPVFKNAHYWSNPRAPAATRRRRLEQNSDAPMSDSELFDSDDEMRDDDDNDGDAEQNAYETRFMHEFGDWRRFVAMANTRVVVAAELDDGEATVDLDFDDEEFMTWPRNAKPGDARVPHWELLGMSREEYKTVCHHWMYVHDREQRHVSQEPVHMFKYPGDMLSRQSRFSLFSMADQVSKVGDDEMAEKHAEKQASLDARRYAAGGRKRTRTEAAAVQKSAHLLGISMQ